MAKVTPELESCLGAARPGEELDLVLEMSGDTPAPTSGKPTTEYVDSMRQAFNADLASVHRLIESVGGAVIGENWLNRVVKVRVPAERISELVHSPEINVIDVPRRLMRA